MNKNEQIKETLRETKERRSNLRTVVYTLKLDMSHLSDAKIDQLEKMFLEAKWLYNYILSNENIFNENTTNIKVVKVKNKDGEFEERELKVLGSQIKQEILQQLKQNIYNLNKVKNKLRKVGRLKFKSYIKSLKLKQPKLTWRIEKNYIKIQGIKGSMKVQGIHQLKNVVEFGEARICKQGGNYYLKVTCYEERKPKINIGKNIGLDFGISTTVTTSDGEKLNCKIKQPKNIKRLNKGIHRKKKRSKNRMKQSVKYERAHMKVCNQKKDMKNKIVHKLKQQYDNFFIQDEQIASWQKNGFGKQINESAIGGIIVDLKKLSTTFIVDKFFPSTQLCNKCDNKQKMELSDRIYKCCKCGHTECRDVNSAKNILKEGLKKQSSVGRTRL